MTDQTPSAQIPVAWLKPIPQGYVIPLWRWLLLPATALMLKRYGGVWMNGTLTLTPAALSFTQVKAMKLRSTQIDSWSIPLADVSHVAVSKGMASETLEIHHAGGVAKLMTARAQGFLAQLGAVVSVR